MSLTGATGALAGRTAVVTGVSRRAGIGFAIARRLGALGAGLYLQAWAPHDAEQPWGADPDGVEGLAAALREELPDVPIAYGSHDFADPAAPGDCLAAAQSALGPVDVLVANHARSSEQRLTALTAPEIDLALAVNVRATLLLVQAFAAAHDDERPGGRVVLMTSGQHRGAMPGELPYIAGKGALHQLTPSLAAELAPRAITVNTVDPGATDTGYATPGVYAAALAQMPMGRWGEPDDAARLIAFLATDDARWITGQVIGSTGGEGLVTADPRSV
jgi:3-oxoacyl-[acyl-carrier protein] reductase